MSIIKILIVLNLLLILVSLGAGMVFLAKDDGRGRRVVSSLTVRIALSISLIALLVIGNAAGVLSPHPL